MSAPSTYWNGEPAECERVRVIVGRSELPSWWCADLKGAERAAVRVRYGGEVFYLDDDANGDSPAGTGWRKVTEGRGSPRWGHRSLPVEREVLAEPNHEHEARKVGRELGLTDLVVLKTGRHCFGWMVRLPDGVAFRGCEESTSEDGAWRALARTLGDLATSARIRLRERDEARRIAEGLAADHDAKVVLPW